MVTTVAVWVFVGLVFRWAWARGEMIEVLAFLVFLAGCMGFGYLNDGPAGAVILGGIVLGGLVVGKLRS